MRQRRATTSRSPALAFKIMTDPFVGSLTFVRVYSGMLETGSHVYNTVKDKRERVGRILQMHANKREEIKEARAGDIVALVGLKNTTTGDTLCDRAQADHPRADGVPRAGHRGRDRAEDEGRPGEAGRRARSGSPTEDPVVPRRAPITETRPDHHLGHGRAAPRDHRRPHAARVQGRRQRRRAAGRLPRDDHASTVERRLHPQEADRRLAASTAASSCASSRGRRARASSSRTRWSAARCRRSTSRASRRASSRPMENGVLAGFPMVDSRSTLIDGALPRRRLVGDGVRDRGARRPSRKACAKAGPQLLEPIMRVEVVTPEDYMGDVIGDLNSRRGQITGMEPRGNAPGDQRHGAARRRCSATSTRCARMTRAARSTPCSSPTTSRCRR